jgi:hypothetical protein
MKRRQSSADTDNQAADESHDHAKRAGYQDSQ